MKDLINRITGHMIIQSIASIILGIVLLCWPNTTTRTLLYALAIYFIVLGVVNIVTYVRTKEFTGDLLLGVLELIIALIIFIFPSQVGGIIGLIMGIIIVLIGIINIISSLDLKNAGVSSWAVILILNIIIVIAGFFVIFNPFSSFLTFTQLLGVILIGKGIVDLISTITFSKNLN